MSGQQEQWGRLEHSDQPDSLDATAIMAQRAEHGTGHANGHGNGAAGAGVAAGTERPLPTRQSTARSVFDPIPPTDRASILVDPDHAQDRLTAPPAAASAANGVSAVLQGPASWPEQASAEGHAADRVHDEGTANGLATPPAAPAQADEAAGAPPTMPELPELPELADPQDLPDLRAFGADRAPAVESSSNGSASRARGQAAGDSPARRADQPAQQADRPALKPELGSLADLRQRLECLPYGHPSSPYHVDGERKPPPPRLKHLELAPPARDRGGDLPSGPDRSDHVGHDTGTDTDTGADTDAGEAAWPASVPEQAGTEEPRAGKAAAASAPANRPADPPQASPWPATSPAPAGEPVLQAAELEGEDAARGQQDQARGQEDHSLGSSGPTTPLPVPVRSQPPASTPVGAAAGSPSRDAAPAAPRPRFIPAPAPAPYAPPAPGAGLSAPASPGPAPSASPSPALSAPASQDPAIAQPPAGQARAFGPPNAEDAKPLAQRPAADDAEPRAELPTRLSPWTAGMPSRPSFTPHHDDQPDPPGPGDAQNGDPAETFLAAQQAEPPPRHPEPGLAGSRRATTHTTQRRSPASVGRPAVKATPTPRGPGFNPAGNPPHMATDGSWAWGPARLTPDQLGVADDAYDRFRAAEGRDLFGSYGGSGLTSKLRQAEERMEHGSLDPHTEEHALLDIDVFRARFAEMLKRYPDRSPELLATRVPGALSYAFIFGVEHYADGILLVQDALEAQGFELQARKNSWGSSKNRCVYTMWHDPLGELPFEVQFHTSASLEAQHLARSSANLINDPRIGADEAASLRSDLASAWAALRSPPGNDEISDYRRYGSSVPRR